MKASGRLALIAGSSWRSERDQVVHDWAQRYAQRLGEHCLDAPLQWFNFYPFWKQDDDIPG